MTSKLKKCIADRLYPGWRNDELVASMLEHQARLRADPERQRLNRQIHRQQLREVALGLSVITSLLLAGLVGGVCWLSHVPAVIVITYPTVQQLAGAIAASCFLAFLLVARPWCRR